MGGNFLGMGVLGTVRRQGAGYQIHPVRVYQGYEMDGTGFCQKPGRYAPKGAVFIQRPGIVPGKLEKNQSGYPLVGVVGGGKENRPLPGAHTQGQHLPPERGAA